jgi:DNA repair exonuclease SbcCD nuclease subunit
MLNIIIVGDPHFKVDNIVEVNLFIEKMVNLVEKKQPDLIIILGDVLHEHERIHTIPLNKAYEFVEKMSEYTKTYILVGNHDYTNNQQYLTNNHWMNGMKKWNNVFVIDETFYDIINEEKLVFVPYVAPGRFEEALNVINNNWKDASCIFAHQEFYGCKMGAIVSEIGDKWPENYPHIISGHIHSNQKIQKNIYYPGSAMQNAFGESDKNIIAYIELLNKDYKLEEIDLDMPRKKIVYMDVEKIDDYKVPENIDDKIKVSIAGDYDEFKSFKKTKKYKELINKGVKVVFKAKKNAEKIKNEKLNKIIEETEDLNNFKEIITNIINSKKDPYLYEIYEFIINNNIISSDDILFI